MTAVNRVTLRPLSKADLELLLKWVNAPHVVHWWDGPVDQESLSAKYTPRLSLDSTVRVFVIEKSDRPIGIIQCYRLRDFPNWNRSIELGNAAGIDYLIGDSDYINKGMGTLAISAMVKLAFDTYPDIAAIVADPKKNNHASRRALEKAGFKLLTEHQSELHNTSGSTMTCVYGYRRIGKSSSGSPTSSMTGY